MDFQQPHLYYKGINCQMDIKNLKGFSKGIRFYLKLGLIILIWCFAFFAAKKFNISILTFIGGAFCHQIPSRSFISGVFIFPLCFRCMGLFAGIGFSLLLQTFFQKSRLPLNLLTLICFSIALLFFVFDCLNAAGLLVYSFYFSNKILRMVSGYALGYSLAAIIYPLFRDSFQGELHFMRFSSKTLLLFAFSPLFLLLSFILIKTPSAPGLGFAYAIFCLTSAFIFLVMLYAILLQLFQRLHQKVLFTKSAISNTIFTAVIIASLQILIFSVLRYSLIQPFITIMNS